MKCGNSNDIGTITVAASYTISGDTTPVERGHRGAGSFLNVVFPGTRGHVSCGRTKRPHGCLNYDDQSMAVLALEEFWD